MSEPSKEDRTILLALLDAGEEFVSGSTLAQTLGLSRVSIRSRIQQLHSQGFSIEAVRNRGYRISSQPQALHGALLRAYLERAHVDVDTYVYNEIDSTNAEAERLISKQSATPFAVLARTQSAGRGRMGRQWHSNRTDNLYLSMGFRPQLPPARMTLFTLWMGVALCDFLDNHYNVPARIKWPNDILCNGRKLAGILTEARIDADYTRDLIFGIGLNVNSDPAQMPEDVREIATSVRHATGKTLPITTFAAEIIATLMQAYQCFHDGSYAERFMQLWIDYDCLNAREVKVKTHSETFVGTVTGIGADGSLTLLRKDGTQTALRAGDVSLTTSALRSQHSTT